MVHWVDLAIITAILWGGVAGAIAGRRAAARQLLVPVCAAGAAFVLRQEMKVLLAQQFLLEDKIKVIVDKYMAVPVYEGSSFHPFPVWDSSRNVFFFPPAARPAPLLFNLIAFFAVFFVCHACLSLVVAVTQEKEMQANWLDYAGGFLGGASRAILLCLLAGGAVFPLANILPALEQLLQPGGSRLLCWTAYLFYQWNGWWT